jgi:hypothetical protein
MQQRHDRGFRRRIHSRERFIHEIQVTFLGDAALARNTRCCWTTG